MARLIGLLSLLLPAHAQLQKKSTLVKFTAEQMARTGAACMDGSPPAYYLGGTSEANVGGRDLAPKLVCGIPR